MNVIVFASRKGGTGKSTLAAHLAAHIHRSTRPCLLIDADPQGSLTLWHRLRESGEPPLKNGHSAINLDAALRYVGVPEEPKPHNALTGAYCHAEVISRIAYTRKLLPDFSSFDIPWETNR